MKQVLLAINGDIPTNLVFQYSVGLCKRMKAELNILQFMQNRKLTHCIFSTKKRVGRLGKFLEDSFAGVAFAEQDVFYMADEFLSGVSDPLKDLINFNKTDTLHLILMEVIRFRNVVILLKPTPDRVKHYGSWKLINLILLLSTHQQWKVGMILLQGK